MAACMVGARASWTRAVIVIVGLLLWSKSALADEPERRLEISAGPVFFNKGFEGGAGVDAALAWTLTENFVTRGSLGVVGVYDRHAAFPYPRLRAEGALQTNLAGFVPMVGIGGSMWLTMPSAHVLAGVGVELGSGWMLSIDGRSGLLWNTGTERAVLTHELALRVGFP